MVHRGRGMLLEIRVTRGEGRMGALSTLKRKTLMLRILNTRHKHRLAVRAEMSGTFFPISTLINQYQPRFGSPRFRLLCFISKIRSTERNYLSPNPPHCQLLSTAVFFLSFSFRRRSLTESQDISSISQPPPRPLSTVHAALSLLVCHQCCGSPRPSSTVLGHRRKRRVGKHPHPGREHPKQGKYEPIEFPRGRERCRNGRVLSTLGARRSPASPRVTCTPIFFQAGARALGSHLRNGHFSSSFSPPACQNVAIETRLTAHTSIRAHA